MTDIDSKARELLYELWISYAEKLLEKVIIVTELSDAQADALRRVALRPNDFVIKVEGDINQITDEDEII